MIRVFILHWNRPEECLRTIRSFLEQPRVHVRVTVIDNGSSHAALRSLEDRIPANIDIVRLKMNIGWGAAFNVVLHNWISHGEEPWCCLSAHDSLLEGDCLARLEAVMQANPSAGIVCPQFPDRVFGHFSLWRGVSYSIAKGTQHEPQAMPFPHGTLGLFRKTCLAEIGLYDERFFAYGDEVEIGLRAWRWNWEVLHVWGASIVNPGSWTPGPLMNYLTTRNSLLLAWLYGGPIGLIGRLSVLLGSMVRLAIQPRKAWMNYSPAAQLKGIRDFFRRRFGKPAFLD